jgi:RHS repeat-associated protein
LLVNETNSTTSEHFGFTGKQVDTTTELQHNLNRWFDLGTGTWISIDPLGFAAGDDNLFRYLFNSAYADYVWPWNYSNNVPVDYLDYGLHYGTKAGQSAAAIAAVLAAAKYAAGIRAAQMAKQALDAADEALKKAKFDKMMETYKREYNKTGRAENPWYNKPPFN